MRFKADTSFSALYELNDSTTFFYNFVSRQDELILPWRDSQAPNLIIQQTKPAVKYSESLFTGLDKVNKIKVKQRDVVDTDWISFILLGLVFLVSWMYVSNRNRLVQVFRASFSYRFVNQLLREGDLSRELINFILYFCFIVLTSMIIFLSAVNWFDISPGGLQGALMFLKIFAGTAIYLVLRILFHRIVGVIFKTRHQALEYNTNTFLISHVLTLILLPLLIASVFASNINFLYISIAIYLLLMLYSTVRGGLIGSTITKFSIMYMFLYLCTLEILPLLILVKVVQMRLL
jgi:hypothetical protein